MSQKSARNITLQTKKFVYLRSTYVIAVQFVGSKHDSREPICVSSFGSKHDTSNEVIRVFRSTYVITVLFVVSKHDSREPMFPKKSSKHDTSSEEFRIFTVVLRHNGAVCRLETSLTRTEESRDFGARLTYYMYGKNGAKLELY